MVENKGKKSVPIGRETKSPPFRRMTGWIGRVLTGRGGLVWRIVGLFALFGFLWLAMYLAGGRDLLGLGDYQITPEKIVLQPTQPKWIESDIPAEVFRSSGLTGSISLMDDALVQKIRDAFALNPWIKKVVRVTKEHPARVRIEVEYRRPVLIVDATDLIPVDGEGVVLPAENFSPRDMRKYARFDHENKPPAGPAGDPWGDPRVMQAARIMKALGDRAGAWNIVRIQLEDPRRLEGTADHYLFDLLTKNGTVIHWGLAPTLKRPGEPTAKKKIEWLENQVKTHGSLDASPSLRSNGFRFR